jgi:hypothetical protein
MKELYGIKDKCLICNNEYIISREGTENLIRLWDYKYETWVHPACAFTSIMEDLRLRNLKEAWRRVFEY